LFVARMIFLFIISLFVTIRSYDLSKN